MASSTSPRFVRGASPTLDPAAAIDRALRMEEDWADIIDVGGESTRPVTEPIGASEELARVLPSSGGCEAIRVPLSVDTYRRMWPGRHRRSVAIINDISALRHDPRLADVVARPEVALVLCTCAVDRRLCTPRPCTTTRRRSDAELEASLAVSAARGVEAGRVIVDPGIGFAKQPDDSYGVLARLPALAAALNRPVLVGPSRKSFMREALGGRAAPERDWGTAAAVTAAVLVGAHIVRVHAVGEMVQVVRVAEEIRRHGGRVRADAESRPPRVPSPFALCSDKNQ